MRSYLLYLLAFITTWVNVQSSTCEVFGCGSIQQTNETHRICVEPRLGVNERQPVETCQANYTCGANSWNNPEQAKNTTCIIVPEPDFGTAQVAGEMCTNTTQCFNHENGANCTKEGEIGYCISPLTNQSDCPNLSDGAIGHDYCPERMFCLNKKCTHALGFNETCGVDVLCQTGLACIATDNITFTTFTCQRFGMLEVGAKFNIMALRFPNDRFQGSQAMCKSYNHADTDQDSIKECRPGDKSADQNSNELRRTGNDQICAYRTYLGEKANATYGVAANETAECGFNVDTDAWCRKRKGDRWFIETYAKIAALDFTQYNCHTTSTIDDCYDAITKLDADLLLEFKRRLYEISPSTGFSRVANNDKCVAESITRGYWQGHDPDSANILGLISAFTIIMSLCGFMLLF